MDNDLSEINPLLAFDFDNFDYTLIFNNIPLLLLTNFLKGVDSIIA